MSSPKYCKEHNDRPRGATVNFGPCKEHDEPGVRSRVFIPRRGPETKCPICIMHANLEYTEWNAVGRCPPQE